MEKNRRQQVEQCPLSVILSWNHSYIVNGIVRILKGSLFRRGASAVHLCWPPLASCEQLASLLKCFVFNQSRITSTKLALLSLPHFTVQTYFLFRSSPRCVAKNVIPLSWVGGHSVVVSLCVVVLLCASLTLPRNQSRDHHRNTSAGYLNKFSALPGDMFLYFSSSFPPQVTL